MVNNNGVIPNKLRHWTVLLWALIGGGFVLMGYFFGDHVSMQFMFGKSAGEPIIFFIAACTALVSGFISYQMINNI